MTTTTILRPFIWDYPGAPVPEETFTHSHHSYSSTILYQLPSTRIHERPRTRTIASSLLNLHTWQCFRTTSNLVHFGLPLGLEPSASYFTHFFTHPSPPFANCHLITARRYASTVYVVVVSVCPSATSGSSIKTAIRRITRTTPYSTGTLVFCCQRSRRNSNGVTHNGGPNAGGVG